MLKPDGLLLSCMLGGVSWQELRISCSLAEQEREGGVSPRVSPLVQVNAFDHNCVFDHMCVHVFDQMCACVTVCSRFAMLATC